MRTIQTRSALRIVIVGAVYFVIGYGSTFLVSPSIRFWRLAAWAASALVYGVHVAYEYFGRDNSPATTSIHVGLAVALGGFLLAVAATTHAVLITEHAPLARFIIALFAWPLITGVPAFLFTFVSTAALRWLNIPRRAVT